MRYAETAANIRVYSTGSPLRPCPGLRFAWLTGRTILLKR